MLLALALVALPPPHLPFVFPCKPPTARLRFVSGSENRPVVGATVRTYAVGRGFSEWTDGVRFDPSGWGLKLLDGSRVSDEHGLVEIPITDQDLLLEAAGGGCWAVCFIWPSPERTAAEDNVWDLSLRRDFDLRVRVLHDNGTPAAGVALVLRSRSASDGKVFTREGCACTTDADGRAVLLHAGAELSLDPGQERTTNSVAIASCVWPAIERAVDPSQPPLEELVLRMPATGEVELAYEETDGTPIRMDWQCALAPESAMGDTREPTTWFGRRPFVELAEEPRASSVVFRNVGLDVNLLAWAQRNVLSATALVHVRGPHVAGERVRVVIHPPDATQVRGQFVNELGVPRSSVRFAVDLRLTPPQGGWPEPTWDRPWIRTHREPSGLGDLREVRLGQLFPFVDAPEITSGENGWFTIDLDKRWLGGSEASLVFIENRFAADERCVTANLDPASPVRPVDLNRLPLLPSPLIASGVAVDEVGRPLAGLLLRGSSYPTNRAVVYRAATRTRADGSFDLRGPCPEKFPDLDFENHEWLRDTHVVPMGTTGLRCVLRERALAGAK